MLYIPPNVDYELLVDFYNWSVIELSTGDQRLVGNLEGGKGRVTSSIAELKNGDEVTTTTGKRYLLKGNPKVPNEEAMLVFGQWLHQNKIDPTTVKMVRPKPQQQETQNAQTNLPQ